MKIGIFTGTFDPFTIGHQNIAERALPMFDKLVIAVAVSKLKHASEEISKRVEDIKAVFPKECSELVDAEDASKGYRLEVVFTMISPSIWRIVWEPGFWFVASVLPRISSTKESRLTSISSWVA